MKYVELVLRKVCVKFNKINFVIVLGVGFYMGLDVNKVFIGFFKLMV